MCHSVFPLRPEYLIVELSVHCKFKLLFFVVYHPLKFGHLSDFENSFSLFSTSYRNLVIIGDLNIDLYSPAFDADAITFRAFVEGSGLYLLPFSPTYHLPISQLWIDHCIVDDVSKVIAST